MAAHNKVFAIHPGDILRTEFMEPLGITAYRLAKELHVSAPRINDLVRGKRSITADTAIRLGKFFGTSPQMWLNLQNDYDLRLAGSRGHKEVKPLHRAA
ncbi:MAG TPA: HigA family addiction module antitoxin [Acidobacteriaceae bacterium]|jgi:addiction module HigA family antidote|nr:HigA family addiction module antitoxin [Acidobacteriaceae bacterium]